MNINERMQLIIDEDFNGNKSAFAKAIGIPPTSISNYLGKERASKPSSDLLGKIAGSLKTINPLWLLTGEGEMKLTNTFNQSNKSGNNAASVHGWAVAGGINLPSTPENGSQKIINENGIEITCEGWPREHARLTSKIGDLEKEVEYLQKDNKRLEEINELLKLQIESLKKQ